MPTVLRKNGFRYYFYANELNEPPHIHVTGKGGEMKVWLQKMEIEFSYGLSPSEQKTVINCIKENQELFMEKWNEFSFKKL